MKKSKPQLQWQLYYYENGKPRPARTKAETQEIDEIVKEHDNGLNVAAGCAERMVRDAKKWSNDSIYYVRLLGAEIDKDATELLSHIVDGRGYVAELISCLSRFEFYESIIRDLRSRRARMVELSRSPKRRVADKRLELLGATFEKFVGLEQINDALYCLPKKLQKILNLPLAKSTYYRYLKLHNIQRKRRKVDTTVSPASHFRRL